MRPSLLVALIAVGPGCLAQTGGRAGPDDCYEMRGRAADILNVVDVIDGLDQSTFGGLPMETTAEAVRAAFGLPDSVRVLRSAWDPARHPDWASLHPTSWDYHSGPSYVIAPDSTATLGISHVVEGGSALVLADGTRLDYATTAEDVARLFPRSWECRDAYPHSALDAFEPGVTAVSVADTTGARGGLTLVLVDGFLR